MSLNLTFALQKRILSLVLVIVLLCGMVAPLPSVHAAGDHIWLMRMQRL